MPHRLLCIVICFCTGLSWAQDGALEAEFMRTVDTTPGWSGRIDLEVSSQSRLFLRVWMDYDRCYKCPPWTGALYTASPDGEWDEWLSGSAIDQPTEILNLETHYASEFQLVPVGVTVSDDGVYFTHRAYGKSESHLYFVNPENVLHYILPLSLKPVNEFTITRDEAGNFYFTKSLSTSHSAIVRITPEGVLETFAGSPQATDSYGHRLDVDLGLVTDMQWDGDSLLFSTLDSGRSAEGARAMEIRRILPDGTIGRVLRQTHAIVRDRDDFHLTYNGFSIAPGKGLMTYELTNQGVSVNVWNESGIWVGRETISLPLFSMPANYDLTYDAILDRLYIAYRPSILDGDSVNKYDLFRFDGVWVNQQSSARGWGTFR